MCEALFYRGQARTLAVDEEVDLPKRKASDVIYPYVSPFVTFPAGSAGSMSVQTGSQNKRGKRPKSKLFVSIAFFLRCILRIAFPLRGSNAT